MCPRSWEVKRTTRGGGSECGVFGGVPVGVEESVAPATVGEAAPLVRGGAHLDDLDGPVGEHSKCDKIALELGVILVATSVAAAHSHGPRDVGALHCRGPQSQDGRA